MTSITPPQFTLYGIKNCDAVRKARQFLSQQAILLHYHDFRSDGLDNLLLDKLIVGVGIAVLVNTRGTTWRQLPEETKATFHQGVHVHEIMRANPSMIKRPILVRTNGKMLAGFDQNRYLAFI